jgi:hypothetical protein
MPGGEVMTPLESIVQKGVEIYTRDSSGLETLVATSPDVHSASWVAWGVSMYHKVPQKVEVPEPNDDIAPEIDDVKRRLAAVEVIQGRGQRSEHAG